MRPAQPVFLCPKAPVQTQRLRLSHSRSECQGNVFQYTSSPQSQTPSLQLGPRNALCVDLSGSSRTFGPSRPILQPALWRSSPVNSCQPERLRPARAAKRCSADIPCLSAVVAGAPQMFRDTAEFTEALVRGRFWAKRRRERALAVSPVAPWLRSSVTLTTPSTQFKRRKGKSHSVQLQKAMPQKSLFKNKKNPSQKALAANRHGKIAKTKKGKRGTKIMQLLSKICNKRSISTSVGNLSAPPKKANLLKAYTDNKVAKAEYLLFA